MLERIETYIRKNHLIERAHSPVVAGISGGVDSMCLLHVLHSLGCPLICAHFDHQLRPDSKSDVTFVRAASDQLGIPFIAGEGDVSAFSHQHGLSIEEAAREMRYQFLFSTARRFEAQGVATGHNADDQVETILMHFLRGAGLSGLQGMQPRVILPTFDSDIPIIRPLLNISRADIMQFAQKRDVKFREDSTNISTTHYRNRLRHELIPLLETYSSSLRNTVLRNAQVIAGDLTIIEDQIERHWNDVKLDVGGVFIQLNGEALRQLPAPIQARLLRKGVQQLLPNLRDFDYEAVQRGLAAIESFEGSKTADLVGGLKVLIENEWIWIAAGWEDLPRNSWPQLPDGLTVALDIGDSFSLGSGWWIHADPVEDEQRSAADGKDVFLMDLDKIQGPLVVRPREAGERFIPAGFGGHKVKISDFMINEKLPQRFRAHWPLVAAGGKIIWVAGLRGAEPYAAAPNSKNVLALRLSRR